MQRREPVLAARRIVGIEPRVEVRVHETAVALPEQSSTCEPARLDLRARVVDDLVQAGAFGDGAALAHEPVEDVVHHVAAVDRRELEDLLGPLDRAHAEHVLDEVGVRATRPGLQLRR